MGGPRQVFARVTIWAASGSIGDPRLASSSDGAVDLTEEAYQGYFISALNRALGIPEFAVRIAAPRYDIIGNAFLDWSSPEGPEAAWAARSTFNSALAAGIAAQCPSLDAGSLVTSLQLSSVARARVRVTLSAAPGTEARFLLVCLAAMGTRDGAAPDSRGLPAVNAALAAAALPPALNLTVPYVRSFISYDFAVSEFQRADGTAVLAADIVALLSDENFEGPVRDALVTDVSGVQARAEKKEERE